MPDPTVNEEIAKLRGWEPPRSPYLRWTNPDGDFAALPLFDSDPAETWELVELCSQVQIYTSGADFMACAWLDGAFRPGTGHGPTQRAAFAAAYLAARRGEG